MRLPWKHRNLAEINYLLNTFEQFSYFLSLWLIELIYRLVSFQHIAKEEADCDTDSWYFGIGCTRYFP